MIGLGCRADARIVALLIKITHGLLIGIGGCLCFKGFWSLLGRGHRNVAMNVR